MTAPRLLEPTPFPAAAVAAVLEPLPPAEALAVLAGETERLRGRQNAAHVEALAARLDRLAEILEQLASRPGLPPPPVISAPRPPPLASTTPERIETRKTDGLIGIHEFQELLGLGERTVRRHVATGKLPAPLKLGGVLRWDRNAVERWLEEGCPGLRRQRR